MSGNPTVFMFSGQGSHYYQMARDLFESEPTFKKHLLRLDDVARRALERSIVEILYDDRRRKADLFTRTLYTSPALFMIQWALASTLREHGVRPDFLLGASLGSYVAAAVGGCFDAEDGLRVVIEQAQILESTCPRGGMLAVLAPPALYHDTAVLRENSELAGVNFASHFVLASSPESLDAIEHVLASKEITSQRLAVSFAFHSKWIDDAERPFRAALRALRYGRSDVPIICTADASRVDVVGEDRLWRAARMPILFKTSVDYLETNGSYRYVDLGPSGTLAAFVKYNLRSDSRSEVFATVTPFGQSVHNLRRVTAHAAHASIDTRDMLPQPV